MKKSIIIFAVVLVLIGGIVIARLLGGGEEKTAIVSQEVVAVTRDLAPGEFLEAKNLCWVPLSEEVKDSSSLCIKGKGGFESLASLEGGVLTVPLSKGALLDDSKILRPGESAFLAAVLRKGYRAFAIQVDNVTGGAGLIRPGNRVDVILSGHFGAGPASAQAFASAQTLLTDVRVLAVNRDFAQTRHKPVPGSEKKRTSYPKKGTITLEVKPKQVEVLTVARSAGTLSLSLRNIFEHGDGEQPSNKITTAAEIVPVKKVNPVRNPVTTYFGNRSNQH